MGKPAQKWTAHFYEDAAGNQPVKDFLDGLDEDQQDTVYNKFEIFMARGWNDSVQNGLLKHVEGKNYELKVKGKQSRVLGFAWRSRFVATAAEIKKQDDLDLTTIKQAEERRLDWIARHGE